MKWIKASERKPTKEQIYWCRVDGHRYPLDFHNGGFYFIFSGWKPDEYVEWLDESHPEQGEQGEVYKWVKASEKPKEADLYPCLCEKNEHGVKTQTITFGEFRKHYDKIQVDEEKYGKVIEWLCKLSSPPPEGQDELWKEVRNIIDEKDNDYFIDKYQLWKKK